VTRDKRLNYPHGGGAAKRMPTDKIESAEAFALHCFGAARKHGPAFDAEDYIAKIAKERDLRVVRAVLEHEYDIPAFGAAERILRAITEGEPDA